MIDEIMGGLKGALEHGYSLDAAVRSMINAGYNPAEVKQAASMLDQGVSSFTSGSSLSPNSIPQEKYSNSSNDSLQVPQNSEPENKSPEQLILPKEEPKKKSKKWIVILLIILLIVIVGLAGIIILSDQLLSLLTGK